MVDRPDISEVRVCRFCGEKLLQNDKWDCTKHDGWFEASEARRISQLEESK
jgi:hypothetical protein